MHHTSLPLAQEEGSTPLKEAIWGWHTDTVTALLELGATQGADNVRCAKSLLSPTRCRVAPGCCC